MVAVDVSGSKQQTLPKPEPVMRRVNTLRRGASSRSMYANTPQTSKPTRSQRWATKLRKSMCGPVPASYSFRQQLALAFRDSPFGMTWDFLQTLLSIVSVAAYVASAYDVLDSHPLDLTLTIVFTSDFFLRWYAAPSRITYPFSLFPVMDILTCLPVYLEMLLATSVQGLGFFRFVRVIRILRVLRLFKAVNGSLTAVTRQMITLVLTVVSMVFLMAGLLIILEDDLYEWQMGHPYPHPGDPDYPGFRIVTFGDAVYYVIVTLATVGYGDFAPRTPLGMACAALFIPLCIIVIPMQVNELTAVLASQSRYSYTYKPDALRPHVLVAGHISNEAAIRELLHELYHPDRLAGASEADSNRITLVMGPNEPPVGIRNLMAHPVTNDRIQYIRGDVKEEEDLVRAAASKAEACFIVSDVATPSRDEADRHTAFMAVLLRTHAPSLPTFIHALSTEAVRCLDPNDGNVTVLAADEVRARLVARAATLPGFSTLLCNLMKGRCAPPEHTSDLPVWQQEYAAGSAVDPHAGPLPLPLDGLSFIDLARLVAEVSKGKAVAIGVQELDAMRGGALADSRLATLAVRCKSNSLLAADLVKAQSVLGMDTGALVPGSVLLNPGKNYRCRAGQLLFVLCNNVDDANEVFDPDTYADMSLPAQLLALGRDLEDGYGFPDAYVETVQDEAAVRIAKEDRRLARHTERALAGGAQLVGPAAPAPAAEAAAPGRPAPSFAQGLGGDAAGVPSLAMPASPAASMNSIPTPSFPSSPNAGMASVPLHNLHTRQADLIRMLEVHDVRKIKGHDPLEDHVIVVCRLADAPRIVAPLRNSVTGAGSHAIPPKVVLLLRQDEPALAGAAGHADAAASALHKSTSEAVSGLESLALNGGVSIVVGSVEDLDSLARAGLGTAASLIVVTRNLTTAQVDGERVDNDVVFSYRSIMRAVRMISTRPYFYAVVELLSFTDVGMLELGTASQPGGKGHAGGRKALPSVEAYRKAAGSSGRSPATSRQGSPSRPTRGAHGTPVHDRGGRDGVQSASLRDITGIDLPADGSPSRGASTRTVTTAQGSDRSISELDPSASSPWHWLTGMLRETGLMDEQDDRASATAKLRQALETHPSWVFLSPLYAAGFTVPVDCIHTLLVPALYRPCVMPLFAALLAPWPDGASRLLLEYIPMAYNGLSYGQLCQDLLAQYGAVVVGLYRCKKAALVQGLTGQVKPKPTATAVQRQEQGGDEAKVVSVDALNLGIDTTLASHTDTTAVPALALPSHTDSPPVPALLQGHVAPFSYVLTHPPRDTRLVSDEEDGDMVYVLARRPLHLISKSRAGSWVGSSSRPAPAPAPIHTPGQTAAVAPPAAPARAR